MGRYTNPFDYSTLDAVDIRKLDAWYEAYIASGGDMDDYLQNYVNCSPSLVTRFTLNALYTAAEYYHT